MNSACQMHQLVVLIVLPTHVLDTTAHEYVQAVSGTHPGAHRYRPISPHQFIIHYQTASKPNSALILQIKKNIAICAQIKLGHCPPHQILYGMGHHQNSIREAYGNACREVLLAARHTPPTDPIGCVANPCNSADRDIFLDNAIANWDTENFPRLEFWAQKKTKLKKNPSQKWDPNFEEHACGGELLARIRKSESSLEMPIDFISHVFADRTLRYRHDQKLFMAATSAIDKELLSSVSINLGVEWLTSKSVDILISRLPKQYRSKLELEILEGGNFLMDSGNALQNLAESGFRLAIDDFGTCNANLDRLRLFSQTNWKDNYRPILKVDKQFVDTPITGSADLLPNFASLARTCNFDLCFEGVESDSSTRSAQLNRIANSLNFEGYSGTVYIQGYAFHRPSEIFT